GGGDPHPAAQPRVPVAGARHRRRTPAGVDPLPPGHDRARRGAGRRRRDRVRRARPLRPVPPQRRCHHHLLRRAPGPHPQPRRAGRQLPGRAGRRHHHPRAHVLMSSASFPVARPPAQARKAPDLQPDELLVVLFKETRKRLVAIAATFAVVMLLTLFVGLQIIPRNYTSSTTILAQDSDIIQPLLEGRAVPPGVSDRAGRARQIVYSGRVLEKVLEIGGWTERKLSPLQRDKLMEDIRNNTTISSPRADLVQIDYRDTDTERAYQVANAFGNMFIVNTLATKARESRDAYKLIDKQVNEYHTKFTVAEQNRQDYRSLNADAQPASATVVNTRITSLRSQVEQARMELLEQESRAAAITSQLSGESAVTAVHTRENLYNTQLIELRAEVDR